MAPGLPQSANDIAWRAGRVMNYGDGIYGGMFVSGMYAAAFFETDPRKVVEAGLAVDPRQERLRRCSSPMCSHGPKSIPTTGRRSGS